MKEIQLTRGYVTQVDDEDYDYLMQWKWYARTVTRIPYAARGEKKGRRTKKGRKTTYTVFMHRAIMNPTEKLQVDHIDHDGLNNQRSNLRICTHKQNMRNSRSRSNSRSKYLGVSYNSNGHIVAQITINLKHNFLGVFKTEEDAARSYDIAAKQAFGEFANLNFKDI